MTVSEDKKTEIYEQYHKKVLGYLVSKLNNSHTAEDLAADVFVKVYEKLDTFDETKASVSTWIYTITRNTLTDFFRTRHVSDEVPETLSDGEESLEDGVIREEMLETLASALEKMPERERDVIIFRYYHGMTLKDIAEKMRISYAYVKIIHNKGLSILREYMNVEV